MQHVVLARLDFAGVHRDGAARIDENDARGGVLLVRHELLLLVERRSLKIRDPVVEEIIGLGLERIGADRDDGVGEFGVLVAIVEFADAHVAGGVDLGVVGGAVMDADVLDLHRAEIELAGAPGVLVAAAGPAVIESGDEQRHPRPGRRQPGGHARHEVERVVPARWLHLAIAPHHGLGQPLLLGRARFGKGFLGHARAADRGEP